MKRMKVLSLALLLCTAGGFSSLHALQTSTQQPDNSAQNANQGKTADTQFSASTDRHTMAQIRKAIIADGSLSLYGHNCKILVKGGKVTLKGPVKSNDEKQKIAQDAASVVNADAISNQLTVKQ